MLYWFLMAAAQAWAPVGWERQPAHWALAGETVEHLKGIVKSFGAKIDVVVAVPEASVPKAFELFGLRFPADITAAEEDCFLAKASVTKTAYYGQAEADPTR